MARASLDRRLEQFQFKAQQQINIAEDKLQRVRDYYQSLQSEITEAEDNLNRLTLQVNQIEHSKKGKIKCQVAVKETKVAALKNAHQKKMHEISEEYEKQQNAMREDFEKTYDKIDKEAQDRAVEKAKPVDSEIKKVIALINKLKEEMEQKKGDSDESLIEQESDRTHEMEVQRIEHLEQKLEEQNKYRIDSLIEAKNQLSECVNVLEEMERNHYSQMERLKNVLDSMDSKYADQIKRDSATQKKETTAIKQSITEKEQQVKSLQRILHRTEKRQRDALQKASAESEYLRVELVAVKKRASQKRENENEFQVQQKKLSEINTQLTQRERILLKMRTDNETLKREIARINQEKQIAKRRAALHIT